MTSCIFHGKFLGEISLIKWCSCEICFTNTDVFWHTKITKLIHRKGKEKEKWKKSFELSAFEIFQLHQTDIVHVLWSV